MLEQMTLEELATIRAVLKEAKKGKKTLSKMLKEVEEKMLDCIPYGKVSASKKEVEVVVVKTAPIQEKEEVVAITEPEQEPVTQEVVATPQPSDPERLSQLRTLLKLKKLPSKLKDGFLARREELPQLRLDCYTEESIQNYLLTGNRLDLTKQVL